MKISASIQNSFKKNIATVQTNDIVKNINLAVKDSGLGSSINDGKFLLLAIATCDYSDVYREAGKKNIVINNVEVEVSGDFGKEGKPGSNITYKVSVRVMPLKR